MKTRFIFWGVIIAATIGSCNQDKESKAMLVKLTAKMNIEARNKAIVRKLMDGLNNRDTMMYEEVYAPNCALYFPSSSTKPKTREADLQSTRRNWKALPDVQWRIEEIVAEGDMVATRFTSSGTQKEEWNGMPASGKKFEIGGIFIVRIENGKVIEQREDADLLGLFRQLGMELKPIDKKK
jgi:steroid delta-isomerase-like uncharacterized protein